jgi:Peptidase family C25
MKNILIGVILSVTLSGFAQQKHFDITWEGSKLVGTASKSYHVPFFSGNTYNFADGEVKFFSQWKETTPIDKQTFALKNIKSEPITAKELYGFREADIPTEIVPEFTCTYARGELYASVRLNPIFKDNGSLKRIRSFDLTYKYNYTLNKSLAITSATSSVLENGIWYKFFVEKSGVYKINKNFLTSLGVNPATIDPRKIKLYGQGGRMLPLVNQMDYIADIQENAIQVIGEEDGIFNNNDYILFYAVGVDEWNEESQTHKNLFVDNASYFITFEGTDGKRIANAVEPPGDANVTLSTFDDYQFHEEDEENIAEIGRRWFGEIFDIETEKTFAFTIPNIDTSSPVTIGVKPATVSASATTMQVSVENQQIITFNFPAILDNVSIKATQDVFSINGSALKRGLKFGNVMVSSEDIIVSLNYNKNGNPSSTAYLDYITVQAKRFLTGYGKQFAFTYTNAAVEAGIVAYNIANASAILQVWDITDSYNITAYPNTLQASTFSVKAILGTQRKYMALDENDFYTPTIINNNKNAVPQNLKETLFTTNGAFADIDYIIITPQSLQQQAQRLADFHQTNSNLNTKVVTLDAIYNEFNAGNEDIAAIRNFIRYAYENASAPAKRIQYICLFGDASIDYKNRIPNNTNIAPVFHSYESFNLAFGVASDDFYTMMDVGEGSLITNDLMDIAVGRILANTPQQASEMVDKIIAYHSPEAQGSWRNNFMLISDDVDASWEGIIQERLDVLGNELNTNKPFININKVHTDSYKQEVSAGGERYPQANAEILNSIELGTLIVNYFGHGNEDGLAGERIYSKSEAQNLKNKNKYPLFIAVTCEFTRFDNPSHNTVGELTYWNKEGGAIGLITTTRQIFVGNGITYNNVISEYLFSYGSDQYTSIAEALRRAKIDPAFGGGVQQRVVFYIGDPALKLAIPKPKINLTEVNDVPIAAGVETLEALSLVRMEGNITDEFDNVLSNYNGTVSVSIYDKPIQRQTLANDGTKNGGILIKLNFTTSGEVIFRGKASVNQGQFNFEFVVPKDIAIPVGSGRVGFYAQRENTTEDQTGQSTDIMVGGINETAPEDNISPNVQLYMNNENFVSGGITNASPLLLAALNDQNGINTASGIGHDIIAFLDGDETNPIVLNDYYEAEVNDYTRGKVAYPLRDLEPGLHTLTLRAWDVYNNSSIAEIQFLVLDDRELKLERVLNYPNPFTSYTEFWFHHNKPFEPLDVQVQVFTVSGKLVWTTNQTLTTDGFSRDIIWDGRDNFGDRIGKGIYVYKITVKSTLTHKQTSKFEKLVIL